MLNYHYHLDIDHLGSRILIREHFSRIINVIIDEFLNEWKDEYRIMSIKLIRNMIIYSEEYIKNTEISLNAFINK